MLVTNEFSGRRYLISVVEVNKQITVRPDVSSEADLIFPSVSFDNIRLEAAVYNLRNSFLAQVLSKPVLVVNVDDQDGTITKKAFSDLMGALIQIENIDDLLDKRKLEHIFEIYDFEAVGKQIWSLFHLSNIMHVFIFEVQ